jgi:2-dehydro-3-deoxyphosphogluconate aldolase/(4S)-4-hydroxy-2-oxoglutarate aldolase
MELNLSRRLVPVAVIDRVDDAVPLAHAVQKAGLDVLEITFRTPAAPEAVRRIAGELPGFTVGAGTILSPDQVRAAREAGAAFGVAPGFNPRVVAAAQAAGLPFVPGVMTPTDIEAALEAGCKIQKFFPAELAGGVRMLAALAGPYVHTGVKFIPLGGINARTMGDYLKLPIVAAIGGSWMVERKLVAAGDFTAVTRLTAEALAIVAAHPSPQAAASTRA